MGSDTPLAIGHNKVFGGFLLVAAVFILGVALMTGHLFPQAITGTILLLVSFGYLTRPAIVVTGSVVEIKNMLGMTLKTRTCRPRELALRDGKLWLGGDRIATTWILDKNDLARLQDLIASDAAQA